jgi:hypothetical protein
VPDLGSYERLRARLEAVIGDFSGWLPVNELAFAAEFVDHNELGRAVPTMIGAIIESSSMRRNQDARIGELIAIGCTLGVTFDELRLSELGRDLTTRVLVAPVGELPSPVCSELKRMGSSLADRHGQCTWYACVESSIQRVQRQTARQLILAERFGPLPEGIDVSSMGLKRIGSFAADITPRRGRRSNS